MKLEVTMTRKQQVKKVLEISKKQLQQLKAGIMSFYEEMKTEVDSSDCEYECYSVFVDKESVWEWYKE